MMSGIDCVTPRKRHGATPIRLADGLAVQCFENTYICRSVDPTAVFVCDAAHGLFRTKTALLNPQPSLRWLGGNPNGRGRPDRSATPLPKCGGDGQDVPYFRALQIVGDAACVLALMAMVFGLLMFPGGM